MEKWIIFMFIYAIFNGLYRCTKKKTLEKNSLYEVLSFTSLISFILVSFISKDVFSISISNLIIILGKSIIVVIAWLLGTYALSKMSVSLYGILTLSKITFTLILSILFLGETITLTIFIGMIIVMLGIILVNKVSNNKEQKETTTTAIIAMIIFCLLSSISAIIDKKLLLSITNSQLHFWFLFFLTIIYIIILLIKQKKINYKVIYKDYWLILASICLVVGDRFLFLANEVPTSNVVIMTIIKQISTIETIILGKIMFKEKNIIKKLLCSLLIIIGIVLTII